MEIQPATDRRADSRDHKRRSNGEPRVESLCGDRPKRSPRSDGDVGARKGRRVMADQPRDPTPERRDRRRLQLLWRSVGSLVRVAYVSRGPLVRRDQPVELEALLDALEEKARAHNLTYLKIQPPTDRHDMEPVLEGRGFGRSKLDLGPTASVRIDLRRTPADLLNAMAPRIRRNIRQSEREGLTIRAGGREDLPTFLEILQRTAQRQKFDNYPAEYWTRVWDEFAPGGWARLFLTEVESRVMSAILLIGYGDTVVYKMGGWSGERTKARPNESMHWAGIQWARLSGYRYYDLEGIPPTIARAVLAGTYPPDPVEGVTRFKLNLGGEVVVYPGTYDALYQPIRARLAQWANNQGFSNPLVRFFVGRRARSSPYPDSFKPRKR